MILSKPLNARPGFLVCLILTVAILAVFWPVRNHEFVSFDDDLYVTQNAHVQAGLTGEAVAWAFTTTHAANWHPVTWLSHMLDCQLYGLNSGGHHFTNLLIHLVNAILLFVVLEGMTAATWRSAFVAALFALHPLHVESVAWVAERKDLLSAFFWLMTMGFYLRYVRRPQLNRYLLVLLSYALGLMAKPMLVTMPFVLLLLDYWPLDRFQFGQWGPATRSRTPRSLNFRLQRSLIFHPVLEKAPFFALATVSSIVTFLVQQGGRAVESLDVLPLQTRFINTLVSYLSYIEKMIWPHDLAVFYPRAGNGLPMWQAAGAGLLLLAISVLVLRVIRRYPYLATGWLWYLGTLVPVIGLVQVGSHAMADRYSYVPLIGLFIMIAWGLGDLLTKCPCRRIALAFMTLVSLSALTLYTSIQIRHWQNSMTLFQHALEVTSDNWLGHNSLGNALAAEGKIGDAIAHYRESLRIKPDHARAHNNLGISLAKQKKPDEAIAHFREALRIKPDFADAHYNLAVLLLKHGKMADAIAHYRKAMRIKPGDAELHNNAANALLEHGKITDAIAHYRQALRIRPDDPLARDNLGIALTMQQKTR
jgi:tetratricopeptide (TPR) repeat protein